MILDPLHFFSLSLLPTPPHNCHPFPHFPLSHFSSSSSLSTLICSLSCNLRHSFHRCYSTAFASFAPFVHFLFRVSSSMASTHICAPHIASSPVPQASSLFRFSIPPTLLFSFSRFSPFPPPVPPLHQPFTSSVVTCLHVSVPVWSPACFNLLFCYNLPFNLLSAHSTLLP